MRTELMYCRSTEVEHLEQTLVDLSSHLLLSGPHWRLCRHAVEFTVCISLSAFKYLYIAGRTLCMRIMTKPDSDIPKSLEGKHVLD